VVSARFTAALVLVALGAAIAGCGGEDPPRSDSRLPEGGGQIVSALAALPGGGVLAGELASGVVRRLPGGRIVARIDVSTGGQRGLLGLVAASGGRIYAAYTARDRRLVVDRLAPGPRLRIFDGPASTQLGNGGHLALGADGRLILGIGDLQAPRLVADPARLNGKLVSLDPRGPAGQRARVLSGDWHNPFAFDVDPRGRVWVADNAPGRLPERIGRGDGAVAPVTQLRGRRAPSGVALLSSRELALCGVVSGTLERFRRAADGRWRRIDTIARDCRYGVARTRGGRLAVSGVRSVRFIRP